MNCVPCGKTFTGNVPYNQHIESDRHKKKISLDTKLADNSVRRFEQNFPCPVCDISFDLFESFQSHTLTLEHATNVSKISPKNTQELSSDVVSSTSNNQALSDTGKSNFQLDDTDTIIPPVQNYGISQLQLASFLECKSCNKHFSGPEPYKQHIESIAHQRKIETENILSSGTLQNNLNKFECDPCKKVFSGYVPYNQHISSEIHRKKLQSIQSLEKFKEKTECNLSMLHNAGNSINEIKDARSNIPWFCEICAVQCSGQFPYEQHRAGNAHKKNLSRVQLLENTSNQESNSRNAVNDVGHNSLNEKENTNLENTCPKSFYFEAHSNQKMEIDYVLPQMTEKMNIVTFDKLNLKEFSPDQKINFDKIEDEEPKHIPIYLE